MKKFLFICLFSMFACVPHKNSPPSTNTSTDSNIPTPPAPSWTQVHDANEFEIATFTHSSNDETLALFVHDPNNQAQDAVFVMPELGMSEDSVNTLFLQRDDASYVIGTVDNGDTPNAQTSLCSDEFKPRCTAKIDITDGAIETLRIDLADQKHFEWNAQTKSAVFGTIENR